MDEVACDTCGGEGGGGMSMNDAFVDTSGVGRGGRPIRRGGGMVNGVASGDACNEEWGDFDHSSKA